MPWFKVDDKLHSHKKIVKAGPAVALWTVAGSWCADQLTDGFVPDYMVGRLMPGGHDMAQTLVDVGLWFEDDCDDEDGYRFNDWCEYQPTAEEVESKRQAARERMRKVRGNKKSRSSERSQDVRANKNRTSENVRLTPTRPDPTVSQTLGEPDGTPDEPAEDGPTHQQVFDRLMKVCGLEQPLTKSEGGRIAKAAKGIRPVLSDLSEIDGKARAYQRKWPDIDLTPTALESNWSQLDASPGRRGRSGPPPMEAIA